MSRKALFVIVLVTACCALGVAVGFSSAKDEPKMSEADMKAMGMDPAMMQKCMEAAAVGPQHEKFKAWVGTWKTEVSSFWMDPANPMKSTGTATFELDLGGRVLRGVHKGDMMGMPFEGRSLDGYDNVKGKNWNLWMDNMSTWPMMSWGGPTADGKSISLTGTSWDPMMSKEQTYKMVSTNVDAKTNRFEMYLVEGGKESKMMEIIYSRS